MKILITGATGFLGHHLIKQLIDKGYRDIRVFVEKNADMSLVSEYDLKIIEGDIRNKNEVDRAIEGIDIAYHLVGMISYWDKLNDLQYDINVNGTKHVVDSCLKYNISKLIYVSSNVTIGYKENGIADETIEYNLDKFNINYAHTKKLAEQYVYDGHKKGLNSVILCPASMYGDGDIRRIHSDMLFKFSFPLEKIYFDGGIAVVDVRNVADVLVQSIEKGKSGERYVLSAENLTFREIRKTIARELNLEEPKIYISKYLMFFFSYIFVLISFITKKKPKLTPNMVKFFTINFYFSNKKSKEEFNIEYIPFKDSIKRAVIWYKENGYL